MGRGKKQKNKKSKDEYYRRGNRSTRTLEHHVPTLFLAKAQEYRISLSMLRETVRAWSDEQGLHVMHVSYKNKAGQRIRITETKKLVPLSSDESYQSRRSKDKFLYVDDVALIEYQFVLENTNSQIEHSFSATDLSRKVPGQMEQLLILYSRGLR